MAEASCPLDHESAKQSPPLRLKSSSLLEPMLRLYWASLESIFSDELDSLTVFDLVDGDVKVERVPWQNFGDASSWLTSDVFEAGGGPRLEAEKAIQKALNAIEV